MFGTYLSPPRKKNRRYRFAGLADLVSLCQKMCPTYEIMKYVDDITEIILMNVDMDDFVTNVEIIVNSVFYLDPFGRRWTRGAIHGDGRDGREDVGWT